MSIPPPPALPRTLADQLRGWTDAELGALLRARPDLAAPAPQDSSQLASRAGTRASVLRAADQLTRLELAVLDAVVALGGTASRADLHAAVHAAPDAVDRALDRVRQLALLWGTDDALRSLSVLTDIVGTRISGLGPPLSVLVTGYGPARITSLAQDLGLIPTGNRHDDVEAIADHLSDRDHVAALVAEVDDQATKILRHLAEEGKDGSVESTERATSRSSAGSPVDQLLARGLLVARDRRHVAVPREVAIALRDGHTTVDAVDVAPELATSSRDAAMVDRAAAGAAFELVRHVDLLLEHWGTAPASALRTGGLGVRDLKATAELLQTDERTAAMHVELAFAADLLATGHDSEGEAAWLPTEVFDVWSAAPVADRWARLALAWLASTRLVGLVGGREAGKPVNALVPDLERAWLPETRRVALSQVAELPDGSVLAAGTGVPSLVERMTWLRPRRPPVRAEAVAWVAAEAAVVGITALGGMSAHGRALLSTDDPLHHAPAALAPLLPDPIDHVLLQADLTAVAPGPLEQDLARNLALVADIESRGGATTYRFTEGSVRRAFDSGWSAAEVHAFLASSARTPVPQALSYLVDDVSRRFGTIRVGAAESFLRSDDEAALTELVHHPKASSLRLRRIAPTVVVSDVPLDVLLHRLRDLGSSPVVEAPDGTVRLARKESLRSRSPRRRGEPAESQGAARLSARAASTVTAIRAGDRAAAIRPTPTLRASEPTTPASTLAVLREAVEAGTTVWIGYVDNHGASLERVVDPVRVEAGWLSAFDHRTEDVRSFAVHRITAVRVLEG
ncbi:MAG: helicase C-terminal domain-containing protein [Nocardioidaceae bacterium]